jgi:N-methylhydantoinase B
LRPDSGGAGKWRGGCGQQIVFRILNDDTLVLARGMERLRFRPWGAHGGRPGAATRLVLNPDTPNARELGKIDVLPVVAGDVIALYTPGGGGWGNPFERDPLAVRRDVECGLISIATAREAYGVAIEENSVGGQASASLRASAAQGTERGCERDTWDSVFDADSLDRLNQALFQLPAAVRARRRTQAFDSVLALLPTDFPKNSVSDAAVDAARAQWNNTIDALFAAP